MSVGDRIRAFRVKRGLSQVELARATGESKQTIYKYETGRIKNIPLDKLATIAAALDVSPVEFTDWDTEDSVKVLKQPEAPYGSPATRDTRDTLSDRDTPSGRDTLSDRDTPSCRDTLSDRDTLSSRSKMEDSYSNHAEEVDFGEYLALLRSRPECRVLLSTAKNATKAEVEENVRFITALRQAKADND